MRYCSRSLLLTLMVAAFIACVCASALAKEKAVAYLTCDSPMVYQGEETTWTLHVENAKVKSCSFELSLGQEGASEYISIHSELAGEYQTVAKDNRAAPDESGNVSFSFTATASSGHYWLIVYYTLEGDQNTYFYDMDFYGASRSDDGDPATLAGRVNEIAQICREREYKTQFEQAKFLHDYLIDCMAYDYDLAETSFSPDAGLLRGIGVCESYTQAYWMLLTEMDIKSTQVLGYSGENHAWNIVNIDGEWCQVDCTRDDGSMLPYRYFCVSDEAIGKTHEALDRYLMPACPESERLNTLRPLYRPVNAVALSDAAYNLIGANGKRSDLSEFRGKRLILVSSLKTCMWTDAMLESLLTRTDELEREDIAVAVIDYSGDMRSVAQQYAPFHFYTAVSGTDPRSAMRLLGWRNGGSEEADENGNFDAWSRLSSH